MLADRLTRRLLRVLCLLIISKCWLVKNIVTVTMSATDQVQTAVSVSTPQPKLAKQTQNQSISPGISLAAGAVGGAVEATVTVCTN